MLTWWLPGCKGEILHMLKRNIAASLLKILCKNLNSVKRYDKMICMV